MPTGKNIVITGDEGRGPGPGRESMMSDAEVLNAMITHVMKNMLSDQQIKELKEWYVNYGIEYTKGSGYSEPSRDQVDDMRRMTDIIFSKVRRGTQ